jgi:hypothetical protein
MCNKRLGLAISKKKKKPLSGQRANTSCKSTELQAKEEFRLWALGESESKISILGWPFH